MTTPSLREQPPAWGIDNLPGHTCHEAGYLVSKNSGWRSSRPVISGCRGCTQCYLYCPDGAISMYGRTAVVDYDFCKGCGICVRICRFDAIRMGDESR